MSKVLERLAREPVMLGELIKSALTLGVSFGLKLTTDQAVALYGFVSLTGAFIVRMFVSPGGRDEGPKDPPKDDEPPSSRPTGRPPLIPAAMLCIAIAAVLFVACGGAQKQPAGCGELDYGALSATCGNDELECNRAIEERQRECDEKIRSGQ